MITYETKDYQNQEGFASASIIIVIRKEEHRIASPGPSSLDGYEERV
jgi:hypothetical protein